MTPHLGFNPYTSQYEQNATLGQESINDQLRRVVLANNSPSVDLLKYTAAWFNLYSAPNLAFQPSEAVRRKLLELAQAASYDYQRMMNFTQLTPEDLACIFRILNSYANSQQHNPSQRFFLEIATGVQSYIGFLCQGERIEQGRLAVAVLTSYNDPALTNVIGIFTQILDANQPRLEPRRETQPQFAVNDLRFEGLRIGGQQDAPEVDEDDFFAPASPVFPPQGDDVVGQVLARNDQLVQENDELRRQLTAARTSTVSQDQITRLQEQFQRERLRLQQDAEYQEALAQQKDIELGRLQEEIRSLTDGNRNLTLEAERVREQHEDELERRGRDFQQVQARFQELGARHERALQAGARVSELEARIRELEGTQASASSHKPVAQEQSGQVRELREKSDGLTIENARLAEQVKALQVQLRQARTSGVQTGADLKAAREEIARLKAQIQGLLKK